MKTRGNGEGTIIERRSKTAAVIGYQVQVSLPDGKRKILGTVKTQREARKLLRQGLLDIAKGRLVASARQTVADYLAAWLKTKSVDVRYKTVVTYQTNINHAIRHIGHLRLDAVRPARVEQCQTALLKEGKGTRSVQQVHTRLRQAFERAVQLELIGRNPCDPVIPPRPKRHERSSLTLAQAATLFEHTRGNWLHGCYVTLGTTGIRLGEALGLTWDDVDLEERTLRLRHGQQRQTGKGLVLDDLKTEKSRRIVPLMAITVEALRAQRKQQFERWLLLGSSWKDCGRVFVSEVGTPLDPANIRRLYYPALEAAGLPRVTLHDLRHTAASLMAAEGVPIHVVQAVLGHSRSSTTLDIYTHVQPSSFGDVRSRMDAAFACLDSA